MFELTITIDDQQRDTIQDLIDKRQDFLIDGGRVTDSDGKTVFLKAIQFAFHEGEKSQQIESAIAESEGEDE